MHKRGGKKTAREILSEPSKRISLTLPHDIPHRVMYMLLANHTLSGNCIFCAEACTPYTHPNAHPP